MILAFYSLVILLSLQSQFFFWVSCLCSVAMGLGVLIWSGATELGFFLFGIGYVGGGVYISAGCL